MRYALPFLLTASLASSQPLERQWSFQAQAWDRVEGPFGVPAFNPAPKLEPPLGVYQRISQQMNRQLRKDAARKKRLMADMKSLAVPRSSSEDAQGKTTESKIAAVFELNGLAVERQRIGLLRPSENILGIKKGRGPHRDEIVIVLAHLDTVAGTPGADDNSSSVTALLEIAREFAAHEINRTLILAATNEEESGLGGARALTERIRQEGAKIRLVINLEMIGYRDEQPGAQKLPRELESSKVQTALISEAVERGVAQPLLDFFSQDRNLRRGDFLAAIANRAAGKDLGELTNLDNGGAKLLSMIVPTNVPSMDMLRGDHQLFWKEGYPAIFVTDTAEYRNPNYHRGSDTPETIDAEFLNENVSMLIGWIHHLAGSSKRGQGLTSSLAGLKTDATSRRDIEEQMDFWSVLQTVLEDKGGPAPQAAQTVEHFWVAGLLSQIHFTSTWANVDRMKSLGMKASEIKINSFANSPGNVRKIIKAIEKSPKKVALYGHSRGGNEILEAYLQLPSPMRDKVERIVLIAAPIFGTGSADGHLTPDGSSMNSILGKVLDNILFGGLSETVRNLTTKERAKAAKITELSPEDLAKISVVVSSADSIVSPRESQFDGVRYINVPDWFPGIGKVDHMGFTTREGNSIFNIPAVMTEAIVRRIFPSKSEVPPARIEARRRLDRQFNDPSLGSVNRAIFDQVTYPEYQARIKETLAVPRFEDLADLSESVLSDYHAYKAQMENGGNYGSLNSFIDSRTLKRKSK